MEFAELPQYESIKRVGVADIVDHNAVELTLTIAYDSPTGRETRVINVPEGFFSRTLPEPPSDYVYVQYPDGYQSMNTRANFTDGRQYRRVL